MSGIAKAYQVIGPTELKSPRRIGILRALHLGDMLCAVPALRALRAAVPEAHITLIGLPWAKSFALRFGHYIDDYVCFPGFPGMPEQVPELAAIPGFLAQVQQRRFDLMLQLHDSGVHANSLAILLGATQNAGYYQSGHYCPDRQRFMLWDEHEKEVIRYLRLMDHLGATPQGTQLEFPLFDADYQSLRRCVDNLPPARTYACIHPGARLPSRRWSPQRFADIADRLANEGLHIVLAGTRQDVDITKAVQRQMRMPAIDLTGKTEPGALAALIAGARLLVCNDTEVSHIAAALATPSVVICSGADPHRWAPLDRLRHRVLYQPIACRPCMYFNCPLPGHPCAAGVSTEMAWSAAVGVLSSHADVRFSLRHSATHPHVRAARHD